MMILSQQKQEER